MSVTNTAGKFLGFTALLIAALLVLSVFEKQIAAAFKGLGDSLKSATGGIGSAVGGGLVTGVQGISDGIGNAASDWFHSIFGGGGSVDYVDGGSVDYKGRPMPTEFNSQDYTDASGNYVTVKDYNDGTRQITTDYSADNGGGFGVTGTW